MNKTDPQPNSEPPYEFLGGLGATPPRQRVKPKKQKKRSNVVAVHYIRKPLWGRKKIDEYTANYGKLVGYSKDLFNGFYIHIALDERGILLLL